MISRLSFVLVKVIDKILFVKKTVTFCKSSNKKNVLLSYVLVPPLYIPLYFKTSHNNKLQCYLMIQYLKLKGNNVYLYDYLNEDVDYGRNYDLFIGHNKTFNTIRKKLNSSVKTILLATGSSPEFGNEQQQIRVLDVNDRKGANLTVLDLNIVPDLSENYKTTDKILLLGNEFVKRTYNKSFQNKISLINNVTQHPYFKRPFVKRTNNFLFISSTGQIHRGLDLLLDIFAKTNNKLYILSAFKKEPDFVNLYNNELYNCPNILALGYLDLDSSEFKRAINDVDFVILPSCSEGQSSSVVNMLTYGLIPVVPENVGLADTDKIGVRIETVDLSGVQKAVERAINLSDCEFVLKKENIANCIKTYSESAFLKSLDQTISS